MLWFVGEECVVMLLFGFQVLFIKNIYIYFKGLDHAGIATQTIVEKKLLKERGVCNYFFKIKINIIRCLVMI